MFIQSFSNTKMVILKIVMDILSDIVQFPPNFQSAKTKKSKAMLKSADRAHVRGGAELFQHLNGQTWISNELGYPKTRVSG